ncbi:ABC transporter ATP-binding protein [Urechidicola vernalis]|uniref:Polysaccharide ABC transporter ATP-binding protein n=1 Tax=Urechidicola vernalis TaxID=3075600 RepID=A0ABU2Y248_9FLAO|nr:polysaccharide ABC transporter ATP-binding protein [Urechidicola sp. P050]MDT0552278.1 polysaccharide ABC transporter ATP-binding protein [Urechidicola sp. P050]
MNPEQEEVILKVANLSKQYRLGVVGNATIKEDIKKLWYKAMGKEDPYLMVGELNDRTTSNLSDYVLALNNINLEVRKGEVLGIIGANGAGKSTLLKILSKITSPTAGTVKFKGRIASLLEVGTGFHGELTGRENIYLNGAILGMTKQEISNKMDEIIEFSGCDGYIDTPVKRYSSGMTVRLAFAVAAFLEPDILIIDEVLAVGDAEFQKKAIGKMKDISRGELGRTVLFVSHNMQSVKNLCTKAILMEKGCIVKEGEVDDVINQYLSTDNFNSKNYAKFDDEHKKDIFKINEIGIRNTGKSYDDPIIEDEEIELNLNINFYKEPEKYHITYHLLDELGESIFSFYDLKSINFVEGVNQIKCSFYKEFFQSGNFGIALYIVYNHEKSIFAKKNIVTFSVMERKRELGTYQGREPGYIKPQFKWERQK